ncbi:MAG: NAD synthetase / Glutamine amidotransferase chain of NAD synthetase [uncultured Solirubrobacteraceae bacterium]|uniref:Glutamine-dependent NAD(+) synthetase n=1 Tax=uncultured Solirubrobacteraceae bacterium TaxID=1162706 RepID=A0A6J4T2I9_9ACTN|nr:MAG: NAD synthetase / Glutamine amidotransferase chain of NAD synthetase [uncultured Solirubrobacteraceae bacterium]
MTQPPLRIALSQLNAIVGDIAGNEARIADDMAAARDAGAQLVCFPELALTGYPPEDLLLKEHFLADTAAALERLADEATGIVAIVGYPERAEDVHNSAAVLADGAIQASYRKLHLPNYGVFDELRYFQPGERGATIEVDGVTVGLTICEDIWQPGPPLSDEALAGARVIVNISASPYDAGKGERRERMLQQRARDDLAAVAFCALVGGQDELVFDGHSLVVDHQGAILARAPQFQEALLVAEVDPVTVGSARLRDTRRRAPAASGRGRVDQLGSFTVGRPAGGQPLTATVAELPDPVEEVYGALVLGTRDYVRKNGFKHVVLGLSGGIDSTLVALIAVDALGADRVTCVTMPSPYSSQATRSDAHRLAENLGCELLELPIEPMMLAFDAALSDVFAGHDADLTEENLQARIRGNLLMALSNKFGWLVLTTGNKSEMSVGYSTLYGDSAGGFAVIKDAPKLLVYKLARHRDRQAGGGLVPPELFTRAPSAELRADQRDDDSLPPYEILDAILEGYVEHDLGREQLVARGLDAADVDRVIRLVDVAEYKRRQQPPGIKVTTRAFGRDRRVPITNRFGG